MSSKGAQVICFVLFRLLLPVTLLAAAVVRFNALSFLYLVCLLVTPLLQYPRDVSMPGSTGAFLKVLVALSSLTFAAQVSFQIATVASDTLRNNLVNCSKVEQLSRQLGFQRVDGIPVHHAVRLIMPDIGVFVVAVVVLVVCTIILRRKSDAVQEPRKRVTSLRRQKALNYAVTVVTEVFVMVALAASSIMIPSMLGSVYLLTGLVLMVMWACYVPLGRLGHLRIPLLIYTGCHILLLHLYQFQFFQGYVAPSGLVPRLLGLTGVVRTDCAEVYGVNFHSEANWQMFINPAVLLLLYWILAFETCAWYRKKWLPLNEGTSEKKWTKHKRELNPERQVPRPKDLEEKLGLLWSPKNQKYDSETGSLVFSGSAYGDEEDDQERLVEELEGNANYNSTAQAAQAAQASTSANQEEQEDIVVASLERPRRKSKRSPIMSFFVYLLKQSYIITLIVMMGWSIKFHSWMAFVLLLAACLLWMMPNSRRATLVASPMLVLYAVCLFLATYIYNINLPELPSQFGEVQAREIGLIRSSVAPEDLAIQLCFLMFFFMTLRQFMQERSSPSEGAFADSYQLESREEQQRPSFSAHRPFNTQISEAYDSYTIRVLGHFFWVTMCKYWIFVCASMLLLISIQEVVIYRIIYLIFFLLFVTTFQVSYSLWRALMFIFWWVVIIYSIGILIMIYTFQFEKFPAYWQNSTGWNNETLADIGLEQFNTTDLFVKLLTPTSFLIVIILQVHYFHKPFLQLSALDRFRSKDTPDVCQAPERDTELSASQTETEADDDEKETQKNQCTKRFSKKLLVMLPVFSRKLSVFISFLWRLAEIHIFKLVIIITMFVAVHQEEVSGVAAVYVLLIALLLPFLMTRLHLVLSHLILIWTCIVILAKTIFQLSMVNFKSVEDDCASLNNLSNESLPLRSLDNAVWLGFRKVQRSPSELDSYIKLYILLLAVVLLESIIRYHQKQHYNSVGRAELPVGILFPLIQREEADRSLLDCLKFFANYTFYKFGMEICHIVTAITVCVRLDVFAVFYTVLMIVVMVLRRHTAGRIWWIYMAILAILLPLQYLMALGFPPAACIWYPWHATQVELIMLVRWLYLPDFLNTTPTLVLMADVVQLLCVCLQWRVFRLELAAHTRNDYGGGDNDEILPEVEANLKIPVEDFTITTGSYLDVCKLAVMQYMMWVTMAVIFITGITHRSIFNMGYMIAVFCFMWYGNEFLLKPLRKLLRSWNLFIAYCVAVLFIKSFLQLAGCVYIKLLFKNYCWVVQVMGIGCILTTKDIVIEGDIKCDKPLNASGSEWDVVCFGFLLIQRRIFSSHYFRHVVDLLEAQSRLASRGAELINRILVHGVTRQKEKEAEILEGIKKKMHALKERQSKLRKDYQEPEEHFQAIRSGDYYLFHEIKHSSSVDKKEVTTSMTYGREAFEKEEAVVGPFQVIHTAIEEGKDAAVEKSKQAEDAEVPEKLTDDIGDEEKKEKDESWGTLLKAVISSTFTYLIHVCNAISRNYRLVARKLQAELKIEKEKILSSHIQHISTSVELSLVDHSRHDRSCVNLSFSKGEIETIASQEEKKITNITEESDTFGFATGPDDLVEVSIAPLAERSKSRELQAVTMSLHELEALEENRQREFEKSQPQALRLLVAFGYVLVSHSELLCYFLMILDQMLYSSLLSLPLPLMVFLWGMLSVPRPSKTFWITVITYTEAVVVTKYLFQFGFFPWNSNNTETSPFFPPRIIGIEQKDNFANVDIALLLALFIHRSILKKYGLWKDSHDICKDMAQAEENMSQPASPKGNVNESAHTYDNELSTTQEGGSTMEVSSSDEQVKMKANEQPNRIKKACLFLFDPFVKFFHKVMHSTYSATVDVYAPMFMCDFINFFIVVFGYKYFGSQQQAGDADVTSYITENRIPTAFLIMLLLQFLFIIIDRALFLRKNVRGKLIYQIFLVILIHIWMFFVLPAVTGRAFFDNVAAQLWYFVKCIYFALSAYQIRCGYPTRILGNFLTKKYTLFNMVLFQGFLAIPFLLELRALMDWIWTDSTLAIGNWLQMEDIYSNIFIIKCWRYHEMHYPTPRGVRKNVASKYGVGGFMLFVIILIIWFPLVLYTFAYEGFEVNPPKEVSVNLRIDTYQPLFQMTVQQNIRNAKESEIQALKQHFLQNEAAISFLNRFEVPDVTVVNVSGQSTAIWGISPPSQDLMIKNLASGNPVQLELSVTIIRSPTKDESGASSITQYFLRTIEDPTALAEIINGTKREQFLIRAVFPRFIQLTAGQVRPVVSLLKGQDGIGYTDIKISLDGPRVDNSSVMQYWSLEEGIYDYSPFNMDKKVQVFVPSLTFITFNDRKAPSTFATLVGYGITSLYIGSVFVISQFIRRLAFLNASYTIMFDELPDVDPIFELLWNICIARELKEFRLEEDLFAGLLFLFRSPETMIRFTKLRKLVKFKGD
ncbi:piezo-type mechanosensitive ion channel component 2-like isoform X5 [Pomacea canaliculata]|uniref:piezo-type mechanosensitive ion channel component 2-like isoform X5 n=1 Tax=Pomacea canaliculata TaxID=400727 RepID=UPI000D725FE1|nr:piezo-type mechanosensitive ion channel component 2-like isoform X5 [Pomacea canaliculata]